VELLIQVQHSQHRQGANDAKRSRITEAMRGVAGARTGIRSSPRTGATPASASIDAIGGGGPAAGSCETRGEEGVMRSGEPNQAPVWLVGRFIRGVSVKRPDEIIERRVSVGEPLISSAGDVTTRRKKKNGDRLVATRTDKIDTGEFVWLGSLP
jgi:hypothetical protein